MDRSALRKVETTNDTEKRLEFKTKLAKNIDSVPPVSPPVDGAQNTDGLPLGGTVWHPNLGACTIFSVDPKHNSIVLESPKLGKVDLVLSQVRSKLVPVNGDGNPALADQMSPPLVTPSLIETVESFSPTNWARSDQPRTVETTSDAEKRLAFKTKLTKNLDPVQPVNVDSAPEVSGLPLGGDVWHPDLGACTIFSVDLKTNSIVLESSNLGKIDLVLSQVRSRLVPVNKDGGPALVDKMSPPFVNPTLIDAAEPFSPTNWHRSDQPTIYTERGLDVKEPQPVKATVVDGLTVGTSVWHPDFGACTISLIDQKSNAIVLDFATFGKLDMVLSQVKSKLVPIRSSAPTHAGKRLGSQNRVKPLPVETASQRSISLPRVFSSWKPIEQFSYLTRDKHLTTEEANGFVAALSGRFDTPLAFEIVWEEIPDKDKRLVHKKNLLQKIEAASVLKPLKETVQRDVSPQALTELVSLSVTLPAIFTSLQPSGQYTFLTNTKHLTPEEANDIIALHGGQLPRNSTAKFELLWDEKVGASEAGVARVTKAPEIKAPEPVAPRQQIDLPLVFKTWKPVEQFAYLTKNKHLPSAAANSVIDGFTLGAPCDYDISWGELPEAEKRSAYKQNLLKKVEASSIPKPFKEPVKRDVTPQALTELVSLAVTLPSVFGTLRPSGQYTFLTNTKHLTPEEANDVIAVHAGNLPRNTKATFELLWDEGVGLSEVGVSRVTKEEKINEPEPPAPRQRIELPMIFKTWKPIEQFSYLTQNKHLPPAAANSVIERLTFGFDCDYDIIWGELPESEKRLAYKQNLQTKVEAASVPLAEPVSSPILPASLTHVGVHRVMVDVETIQEVSTPGAQRLSVTVPHEFKTWNASDQYIFFTKTKKLTPNEANDLISIFTGTQPQNIRTQYEFVWDTLAVGLDASQVRRSTDSVEVEEKRISPMLQKLTVTLPKSFKKWRASDQFSFLAHNKHLSAEEANDIMATYQSQQPLNRSVTYEITWDDNA